MAARVLLTDRVAPRAAEVLAEMGVDAEQRDDLDRAALLDIIGGYDGLVVRSSTRVDAELLGAAHRLRIVGRAGIGVDNIDLQASRARDVAVCNTPGGNANAVAELAVGMMLSLVRHIPLATVSMHEGEWRKKELKGRELRGQTLGVVGLGAVGRRVSELGRAMGMTVLASDPFISTDDAAKVGAILTPLDQLVRNANVLTVHVPLVPATRNLVDRAVLASLPAGALVLNLARGGIVDEDALLEAIDSGRVAGAAIDVWPDEPPPKDHPLRTHPRVLATPHIAASTHEAQVAVAVQAAEQVGAFLVRGERRHIVNGV